MSLRTQRPTDFGRTKLSLCASAMLWQPFVMLIGSGRRLSAVSDCRQLVSARTEQDGASSSHITMELSPGISYQSGRPLTPVRMKSRILAGKVYPCYCGQGCCGGLPHSVHLCPLASTSPWTLWPASYLLGSERRSCKCPATHSSITWHRC